MSRLLLILLALHFFLETWIDGRPSGIWISAGLMLLGLFIFLIGWLPNPIFLVILAYEESSAKSVICIGVRPRILVVGAPGCLENRAQMPSASA